MNPTPEDARVSGAGTPAVLSSQIAAQIEGTLRMLAQAPAPVGLEERIHAALEVAGPREARLLAWPAAAWPSSMRAAAAAAIVVIVTGGGWGVYSRVQHLGKAAAPVVPQVVVPAGGFSSAGAIRTPQTVQGPAVQADPKKPEKGKKKPSPPGEKLPPPRPALH